MSFPERLQDRGDGPSDRESHFTKAACRRSGIAARRRVSLAAALGAALGALALLTACAKKEKAPPPPPEAGFVVVHTQSVALVIELPGRTNAFETSDVRPQVAGVIKARLFTEGAIVHKGQALYQIDPSLYRAAVNQAAANLQSAEANRQTAVAKADRYRPLAKIQAVAQQDYSDAEAQAKQAIAAVAQNRAMLDTARINLHFTTVPAPIDGRIGRSLFTTGALVTVGQTDALAQIQRLDPIYVDIQQSSGDLVALRQQLAKRGPNGIVPSAAVVRLKLENGTDYPFTGRLEFAEAVVDTNTGAVTLRARFPNPQGLLLPGMFVRAQLSQATTNNGILVPQQAVSRDPQGVASVLIVGPGNKPVTRTVVATQTVGTNWLVTSGLAPGDRVIVEGLGRIKTGQQIKPVPAGSKPSADEAHGGGSNDKDGG